MCIFSSPTQVMRGSRLQEGAPGSKRSAAEAENWESLEISIVRKRIAEADPGGPQLKKKAKASAQIDRLASLDVLNMSRQNWNNHRTKYYIV